MTTADLYTPFQNRVRQLCQTEFGSDDHRKLVGLAAKMAAEQVWTGGRKAPAWALRVAERFAAGTGFRWCDATRARKLVFKMERTLTGSERVNARLADAVLSVIFNPLAGFDALETIKVTLANNRTPENVVDFDDEEAWLRAEAANRHLFRTIIKDWEARASKVLDAQETS